MFLCTLTIYFSFQTIFNKFNYHWHHVRSPQPVRIQCKLTFFLYDNVHQKLKLNKILFIWFLLFEAQSDCRIAGTRYLANNQIYFFQREKKWNEQQWNFFLAQQQKSGRNNEHTEKNELAVIWIAINHFVLLVKALFFSFSLLLGKHKQQLNLHNDTNDLNNQANGLTQ